MDVTIKAIAEENEFSIASQSQAKEILKLWDQKIKLMDSRTLYYTHGIGLLGPIVNQSSKRYDDRASALAIVEEIIPDFWVVQLAFK
jgi:hypothetical protein